MINRFAEPHHLKRDLAAEQLDTARQRRLKRLWRRFLRLMTAEHGDLGLDTGAPPGASELQLMRRTIAAGGCPGWYLNNVHEATDLGMDDVYAPRPPETPCGDRGGTAAKVEVLAARAERGEELWHPEDGGDLRS